MSLRALKTHKDAQRVVTRRDVDDMQRLTGSVMEFSIGESSPPSSHSYMPYCKDDFQEGVTFEVKYLGCLEITTSMKTFEIETRSRVARECMRYIHQITTGIQTDIQPDEVIRYVGKTPLLDHAGDTAELTVSLDAFTLRDVHHRCLIARHEIHRISFASGGDSQCPHYVAYVAKNMDNWRACYVFECKNKANASEIITIIEKAFKLRYCEFMRKNRATRTPSPLPALDEANYYNDLPGKMPPDLPDDVQLDVAMDQVAIVNASTPVYQNTAWTDDDDVVHAISNYLTVQQGRTGPTTTAATTSTSQQARAVQQKWPDPVNWLDYSQQKVEREIEECKQHYVNEMLDPRQLSAACRSRSLWDEDWYHGALTRDEAETLVVNNGDFLVRDAQNQPDQYVLSGVSDNVRTHLVLKHPSGMIRTKDKVFFNICHLIHYHYQNQLPLLSNKNVITLTNPIKRTKKLTRK